MTHAKTPTAKATAELLHKGVLCVFIGLAVLIAPRFMASQQFAAIVGQSALVGWFAIVLGAGLIVQYLRRMAQADKAAKAAASGHDGKR